MPFTAREIDGVQGWRFRENYIDRQLAYNEKEKYPNRDVPQLLQPFVRPAPSPTVVCMLGYPKKMICPNPPPNTSREKRRVLGVPQNKLDRVAVKTKSITQKLSSTSLCGEDEPKPRLDETVQSQSGESTSSKIQPSPHKLKPISNPLPIVENKQIKAKIVSLPSVVAQQNKKEAKTQAKKPISGKHQTPGNPVFVPVPVGTPIFPPPPNIHGLINKMTQRAMITPRLLELRTSRKPNVEYWTKGELENRNSAEILNKQSQFDKKKGIISGDEIGRKDWTGNSQNNVRLPNFGFGLGGMGGVAPATRLVAKGKQMYPHSKVRRDKDYL